MTLNDWLKAHNMTQTGLAQELKVTRETVNRAANGKPSGLFLWRFAKLAGFDAAKQLAENTKE
jgi:transcriptional regulator with XRE-family HTH domain